MEVEEVILRQLEAVTEQMGILGKDVARVVAQLQQKEIQCQKDREDRDKMLDLLQMALERVRVLETTVRVIETAIDDVKETKKSVADLHEKVKVMETQDTTKEKVEEKHTESLKYGWGIMATVAGAIWAILTFVYEHFIKR